MGCFWGPQTKYSQMKGVNECIVGYTGGSNPNPTYKTVCDGDGHIEAIYIKYDDEMITYEELVNSFFDLTKPIIKDGGQYSSKIWIDNDEERQIVEKIMIEKGISTYTDSIVSYTQKFYKAEMYHQDFNNKNTFRYLFLIIGVILSLLPNLDPVYYKIGAFITISYIITTLFERFTNNEVKEIT
jgi:methionine-S-sulfoxide reductase